MKMKSKINMKGIFSFQIQDAKTGEILKTWEAENLLTNLSRKIRNQMLSGKYDGGNNELAIRYFAFGTGEGNPSVTDTKLFHEIFRKPVSKIICDEEETVQSICSLGASEGNGRITEIGVFCGDKATIESDSGNLLSHISVDIKKDNNVVLNVARRDICTIN